MLKFLFILFLLLYLISKLGRFFLQFFLPKKPQTNRGQRAEYSKPADGNVNIDFNPKPKHKNPKTNFKGGEYVSYEEVD